MRQFLLNYTCTSCGHKDVIRCDFYIQEEETPPKLCGRPSYYHYTWSDREGYVCETHKDEAVTRWYDGDHEYDRTGLWVRDSKGLTKLK